MAPDTLSPASGNGKAFSFYVYLYRDPRPGKDGCPIYVGKGKERDGYPEWRARSHWRHGTRFNPMFQAVLNKIRAMDLTPDITVLARFRDELDAFALEISLIAGIGRRDKGLGPLLNMTDGGDGIAGLIVTPEMRQKHRAAGKNTWAKASPEFRAVMLSGIPWHTDPELDAKRLLRMVSGRAKRWSEPGVKEADAEAIRQAQLARRDDVSAKTLHYYATASAEELAANGAKISAAKRRDAEKIGKTSEEVWARPGMNEFISGTISEGQTRAWAEPRGVQRRETASVNATKQFSDPVSAQKHKDGVNAKWADPERKAMAVAKMLATRAANKAKKEPPQGSLL